MVLKSIPSVVNAHPGDRHRVVPSFNVGDDASARAQRAELLRAFSDSVAACSIRSPMYGSSGGRDGDRLGQLGRPPGLFAATRSGPRRVKTGPPRSRRRAACGVSSVSI